MRAIACAIVLAAFIVSTTTAKEYNDGSGVGKFIISALFVWAFAGFIINTFLGQ